MIDHNFAQYGIDETYSGEAVLPSEKGNTHTTMALRQFVQLARRAYSANALELLEASEGLKITEHQTMDDEFDEVQPFFHFSLTFRPKSEDLQTFVESDEADRFYERVLALVGRSYTRGISGARTAFVGEFNRKTTSSGLDVMVAHVFVGTSVFFNDYRVTTNYPASQEEADTILESIFTTLSNEFDIALEIAGDE